jgi:glycerol-3-phosphate acyltransferase PlsX
MAAAPSLRRLQAALSADLHGGAFLLGLRGVVVKSHGASSETGFAAAIDQAARCLEQDMVPALSNIFENQEIGQE